MQNYNLQLFSVRNSLDDDFEGTLKKISDIGYDGVEFFGSYGGYSGDELAKILDFYGLSAISSHVSLEDIEDDEKFSYHCDILSKVGCMYMFNPYAAPKSADEAAIIGERLEKAAEKCAVNGFNYGHHTHGGEIENKDKDGVSYFDIMMEQAPLCLPEMDIFWVKHAGADIESYLRRYAGRINLLHLKQMKDLQSKEITSLDNGIIDIKSVIKTAEKFGTEHFIVEQDVPTVDELTDAQNSLQYLKML